MDTAMNAEQSNLKGVIFKTNLWGPIENVTMTDQTYFYALWGKLDFLRTKLRCIDMNLIFFSGILKKIKP